MPDEEAAMSTPVLDTPVTRVADDFAMRLLGDHIPLTLLLDLAEHFGPLSSDILHNEISLDPSADLRWIPGFLA
jgi:hypothetical protein